MENFRWARDGARPSLTSDFILSGDQAPRLSEVLPADAVALPTLDMAEANEEAMAERIAVASAEFGLFRVINHGLPEEVWRSAAESVRDFFMLPPEVKSRLAGGRSMDGLKVYRYFVRDWEDEREVSMWSEVASHVWHPTDDFAGALPEIPANYRVHVAAYAKEMGVLMTRLLRLLSKGLGLEHDCIKTRLGHQPFFKCHGNYYPPCPNPDITIGLPIHTDSLALSVVRTLDDVSGLQILKDEQWVAVDQPPGSFIVNIGDQLEVLSNGRYKSVVHRVVTNESRPRVSLAFFWGPGFDETVGPIKDLVDEQHPPMYKSYVYKDFLHEHDKQAGKRRRVKELFLLNPTN